MGRVKIIPWTMPNLTFHGARICHGNFQLAMIGDCHMRNINKTRYLLGQDFDEIITPYGNATSWLEMIKHSKCNQASSIIARHTLFANHPQSEIDALCAGFKPYFGPRSSITRNKTEQFLSIMCITKRMSRIFGVPARAKYISKPSEMKRLDVHVPLKFDSTRSCRITSSLSKQRSCWWRKRHYLW